MASSFAKSMHWKSHDPFLRQKLSTFKSSRPAILELAARYKDLMLQIQDNSADEDETANAKAQELLFIEMCEICLWGNATDLSLLTNMSYDDIQKLQGSKARKAAEEKIVVNDLPAALSSLKKVRERDPDEEVRVDIILDNAGFELYVDLILAGFLIASRLADTVVLHPKSIPWFVSDVIPAEFQYHAERTRQSSKVLHNPAFQKPRGQLKTQRFQKRKPRICSSCLTTGQQCMQKAN